MNYELDRLCHKIIGAAIEVHKTMGPGLLEKIYVQCLCLELNTLGLSIEREKPIPLMYKGIKLGADFKADIVVEDRLIVEIKAVTEMNPLYEAQLISYLTLSGLPTGLLINFNVILLKDGIRRLFPIK